MLCEISLKTQESLLNRVFPSVKIAGSNVHKSEKGYFLYLPSSLSQYIISFHTERTCFQQLFKSLKYMKIIFFKVFDSLRKLSIQKLYKVQQNL